MSVETGDTRRGFAALGLEAIPLYAAFGIGRIIGGSARPLPSNLKRGEVYGFLRRRALGRIRAVIAHRRLFLGDLLLAPLALVLAGAVRLGLDVDPKNEASAAAVLSAIPAFVLICALVFPFTCLYVRNWRYASVSDLLGVARAVLVASLAFVFWMFIAHRIDALPRSVVVIEALLLVPMLVMLRVGTKTAEFRILAGLGRARRAAAADRVPVLLIGAGDEADLYLRALQRDEAARHWPVGILTRTPAAEGFSLRGVPILGTVEELEGVIADLDAQKLRPRHLIFTEKVPGFTDPVMEAMINEAERLGLAISRPAPVLELRDPKAGPRVELRPIELTDLLERPQAALDRAAIRRMVEGCRVVVTGAGGSIGGELCLQLAALGPAEIVLIESSEYNLYAIDLDLAEKHAGLKRTPYLCNVRDAGRLDEIFARHRPDLVFHAAALKHVPMVEMNPCEGILTNVLGTMNVAEATRRCGARAMVQISTDKVVNATSVMGATKRLAELYCQALDLAGLAGDGGTRFMTVRFGNVLGSSGSLIPLFKRQLARGGPLTVTDLEMKRFFMTIREAVELTLQASAYGLEKDLGQGEIFVLDMGEPIRIVDMARRMIRLAGLRPDEDVKIEIVGCRPGEKLFEELFDESERRVASPMPGVLGAVPHPVPLEELREAFAGLKRLATAGEASALVALIGEILPSYRGGAPATASQSVAA